MSLEEILRVTENDPTGRRDSQKYYVTVYGQPSQSGSWGWRVEGHHLSLHFTIKDGKLIATSPTFFGANPHEVRQATIRSLLAGWCALVEDPEACLELDLCQFLDRAEREA